MRNLKFYIICFSLVLFVNQSFAFKCYITAMKSKCWQKHNVTIKVVDNVTGNQVINQLTIAKDKLWVRKEFDCQPKQGLVYTAQFEPYIWHDDEGKVYNVKRIWFLPEKVEKKISAWNIPICFPNNFSEVPILPDVDKYCNCESTAKEIPPIPLQ